MQRIAISILAILAIPIYLLIHSSTQIHHHEFTIPKNGWKRRVSDFYGAITFLLLLDTAQAIFLILKKSDNSVSIINYLHAYIPFYEIIIIHISIAIVIWMCWNGRTNEKTNISLESKTWIEKLHEIKLPTPFDVFNP